MMLGFQNLGPALRNNSKILIHSAIGLEKACTIPSNQQYMGLLVLQKKEGQKERVNPDILEWI